MIVALNNKSNLTKQEFFKYQESLGQIKCNSTLILCTSLLNIGAFNITNCYLGSQNVSKYEAGAHTGEIAASQLKSYNVKYSIVGHSERRIEQKETTEEINQKIKRLFKEDITPILCIGETKEERTKNLANQVIKEEIYSATKDLTEEEKAKLIIAYEPIWSIGTGILPTTREIQEVLAEIKKLLPTTKVLYGGSANEENIEELKKCSLIDGYLLGGLSLKPDLLKIFLEKLEN